MSADAPTTYPALSIMVAGADARTCVPTPNCIKTFLPFYLFTVLPLKDRFTSLPFYRFTFKRILYFLPLSCPAARLKACLWNWSSARSTSITLPAGMTEKNF